MRVLVVNAGSSSTKLRVVDEDDQIGASADLGPPGEGLADQLRDFVADAGALDAAGHRVVHGGNLFTEAVIVDDAVRHHLDALSPLAPLHNPPALAAIDALRQQRPGLPTVVCFDTAFHADLPAEVTRIALPSEWMTRSGIRRYGFHGLSCAWATARAAELLGWPPMRHRLIVCHLGAGASVTAVVDGRSADTTMGFTPLEGLVMATRPGDVDPGAISRLLHHEISLDELDHALEHRSGLAALSGEASGDMRALLKRRSNGDGHAGTAIGVYLHRLRAKIAAMAAATEGLDVLVFTGGVGENSSVIRTEACAGLGWLGVDLDGHANACAADDAVISSPAASVPTVVVHAREELVIAAACRHLLAKPTVTPSPS
ncbi:MAG: acetate/propionate family kinase [Actinomycetota bacterium]|nr:acetate/propionate family kinase [Actinomycetota bacterium]